MKCKLIQISKTFDRRLCEIYCNQIFLFLTRFNSVQESTQVSIVWNLAKYSRDSDTDNKCHASATPRLYESLKLDVIKLSYV